MQPSSARLARKSARRFDGARIDKLVVADQRVRRQPEHLSPFHFRVVREVRVVIGQSQVGARNRPTLLRSMKSIS